ncbi:MAG: D-tyrosyl-tRNA(Tyr) deacylase [Firmicutes bacterium]|nr:D-tyrosyl-tRNA(Tyr) deacylase [Bacillota bacterium]
MRAVVQRVLSGKVSVAGGDKLELLGAIGPGLVVLLGVAVDDTPQDARYLAEKIVSLRIFNDFNGKLNRSTLELKLPILSVSQFTLFGDCRHGRRPSFTEAAPPELGERLYDLFCETVQSLGVEVIKGRFRSNMIVEINNDGPVTLLLDSKKRF